MRKYLLLFVISFLGLSVYGQKEVFIPKGTDVFVKTNDVISSTSKTKQITGFVTTDVVVNREVVIKAETPVVIEVSCRKRGGIGRPGRVSYDGVSTTTVDGHILKLNGSAMQKGVSKRGKSIGLTIGMFFLIPPFNFLFLCKKGEECDMQPITIPMKTESDVAIVVQ